MCNKIRREIDDISDQVLEAPKNIKSEKFSEILMNFFKKVGVLKSLKMYLFNVYVCNSSPQRLNSIMHKLQRNWFKR